MKKFLVEYQDASLSDAMGRTKIVLRVLSAESRQEARYKCLSLVHRIIVINQVKALLERKAPKKRMLTHRK